MQLSPIVIPGDTPVSAWKAAMGELIRNAGAEMGPVVVHMPIPSIPDLRDVYTHPVIQLLDKTLIADRRPSVRAVGSTIFPLSMWRTQRESSAEDLYERYKRLWKRLKARCPQNRRGTYFQRLIALNPGNPGKLGVINQLQHIIDTYNGGNHRRSALVAALFDPASDHNHCRQLGFPCLHQVGVVPDNDGYLDIVGYYTLQYHYERSLGNYLGLCGLAHFIAFQTGLRVRNAFCIASVLSLGGISKSRCRERFLSVG